MVALAAGCKQLASLGLYGCDNISDAAMVLTLTLTLAPTLTLTLTPTLTPTLT